MFNADIKQIKSLSKKSERVSNGLFVGEGEKVIRELIDSGLSVRKVYVTDQQVRLGVETEFITASQMERISQLKSPSSALALIEIPKYDPNFKGGLGLVLDGVQDPGNIGTIIRIAAWYGVKQIFCSLDTADCFATKVVQATMGAIGAVEVIYTDLKQFLEQVQTTNEDVKIYGTFLENSTPIYSMQLPKNESLLVMGNEGNGISSGVEKYVKNRLYLPSYGDPICVESLNVGVATAVAIAEFRRQQE